MRIFAASPQRFQDIPFSPYSPIPLIRASFRALASLEIPVLGLLFVLSLTSPRLRPVTVWVAGGFWVVRWIAWGAPGRRTPADLPVLLLLLALPVTLWATALPEKTHAQVWWLLNGVALCYAVVNWARTPRRLYGLAMAVVVSGLGLVAAAPRLVVWDAHPLPALWSQAYIPFHHLLRPSMHTNAMGGALALLLPIGLAFLLYAWRRLRWVERGLLIASVAGMSVVFTRCDSHGATLALWAGLVLLAFLRWGRAWKRVSAAALGALLGCAIGAAIFDLYPALQALLLDDAALSLEGRLEIWSRAIYMTQDFPFTGIGMGSFRQIVDALYPLFLAPPGTTPHAHNLYLQIAVDLGLPGLIAWLAVLSVSFIAALQVYRRGCLTNDHHSKALGAGLLCSLVVLITHGLVDSVTWGLQIPSPLVWSLFGLALAAQTLLKKTALMS